jgi:hypothetical protein
VWALPTKAFGRFVARIPAPLGIGTLLLADGTRPKGFLCEVGRARGREHLQPRWVAGVCCAQKMSLILRLNAH